MSKNLTEGNILQKLDTVSGKLKITESKMKTFAELLALYNTILGAVNGFVQDESLDNEALGAAIREFYHTKDLEFITETVSKKLD